MCKSTGVPEKVILPAADLSTLPLVGLVVAVAAEAEADVAVVEEEVAEAVQALQKRHHSVQMRRLLIIHMALKSRPNGEITHNGRPHNRRLLMDTILANTRTPHPTLHGRILKI